MATRYSGEVKISCHLVSAPHMPHGEQYKCTLSVRGKKRATEYVGIPRSLDHAIDSKQAYDDASRAALSFAVDEGKIEVGECWLDGSGWIVRSGHFKKSHTKHKRSYRRR